MSHKNVRSYYEKKLSRILKKYRKGTATPAERDFITSLDDWLEHRPGYYEHLPEEAQRQLVDKMLQEAHTRIHMRPLFYKRHPLLIKISAAAAVLVLCMGVIRWRYDHAKKSSALLTQTVKNENPITPGYNGAILMLSDGQKILLDSTAGNRTVYDQHTRIDKQNGVLSYNSKGNPHQYNEITTPAGRQWKLVLPDGTKAWLNAASSIRYPTAFDTDRREVSISGEVYFEVVHHKEQPFFVEAGGQSIEDIGTAFNVNAYGDRVQVQTTVAEGSVRVTNASHQAITLHPGQQASLDKTGRLLFTEKADLENVLAWKNGIFSFKDADIATIMRQVSRWYNVNVVYEGKIPGRLFTGEVMRNAQLTELLKILSESNIHFEIKGSTITVKQ